MRYALKIGYDGSRFHGSQRQAEDDILSVDGVIVNALRTIGEYEIGKWPIEFASRTDAGVSALGNVIALETEMEISELMRALNANMDGVWCIASGKIRDHQNVRWANSRWYRYHLKPGEITSEDLKGLDSAVMEFVGFHDFTHFCRLEDGKDPKTHIQRAKAVDLAGNGEMVVIDIVGDRFLWNQIRRMVGAALRVTHGQMDIETLRILLRGESAPEKDRIRTMPPTGLVLMDVNFKDIEFEIDPEAIEIALNRNSQSSWEASVKVLLHSALRSLKG